MYHASPHLTYLLQTDLLKPDVSKLNYPLYPPWDWAEKSFRCYSHSANPLLTGVPAEGFGLLIVSARLQMFQPVKVRCYEISKTLKTVSRPIIIRGRTRKKTTFPAQKEVRAWRKCLVVLQEHSMASGEVPVLQAGKKDKFVFKKGPFLLLKTSLSFFNGTYVFEKNKFFQRVGWCSGRNHFYRNSEGVNRNLLQEFTKLVARSGRTCIRIPDPPTGKNAAF